MKLEQNRVVCGVAQALALMSMAIGAHAATPYEAEAGAVVGGANVQSASNASGGRIVGHIADVGAYTQVSVDGGSGGAATLTFRAANGYSAASRLSLYVNGVRLRQLAFAPTGDWNNFIDVDAGPVTLLAGSNSVRLQHDAGDLSSADIDRISVAVGATPAPATTSASYEAESGAVGGGANIQPASNASGGRIVGHIVDTGAYLQFSADGGSGGLATLTFRAANAYPATSRLSLYVNGLRQGQLAFAQTANWNTFIDVASNPIKLAAGANTIRLQHDAGDVTSADIDRIVVTTAASQGSGGAPKPDTQAPTPPSGLGIAGLDCRSVTLSWTASTDNVGVAFYDIYHDGQKITSVSGSTLSTALTVPAGANWGLYVNARDDAGNVSQASTTYPVTVPQCQIDTQAPTTPGGLKAGASGTTATLSWAAATDNVGVTAYDIYRNDVKVGSTAALTYNDTGLAANTTYRYAVAARDAQSNVSAKSVSMSLTTGSACNNAVCSTSEVATDSDIPWGLAALPDGTVLYNRRDSFNIVRLNPTANTQTSIGTVPNVEGTAGEGGLLGLAVTPNFPATDPWLYIYHTSPSDNRIVRIKYTNGTLDTATLQVLLTGIGRNKYHNGGRLRFGPDGKLYATAGDAQNGDNAQVTSSLNGKILRLNSDGSVPSDNPFGNYVWSYGHRNPQGLAFDSQGRLWEQEFGNDQMDETNLIQKGGNYGWPNCEGTISQGGNGCGTSGYIAPAATYVNYDASCSGLAIVRDVVYVACQRGTRVYRHVISGTSLTSTQQLFSGTYGRLRTVEPSIDGGLWLTTTNGNGNEKILKVNLGN